MAGENDLNSSAVSGRANVHTLNTAVPTGVSETPSNLETVSQPQADQQPTTRQIVMPATTPRPADNEISPALSGHAGQDAKVYPGEPDPLISTRRRDTMDNDEVIATLNNLLESNRDGEHGYRECAQHVQSAEIKAVMLRHADSCAAGALELEFEIRKIGGKPEDGGTVTGAMHRGWVSLRSTVIGRSDQAMLGECERGEDAALARYQKAVKEPLPAQVRSMVERQMQGVERNQDQIGTLRAANQPS